MAGIDKIIEDIRAESAETVSKITSEAKAQHDAAMAEAQKDADAAAAKIVAKGKRAAEDLIARADSAASLERSRAVLATKQKMIAEAVGTAKRTVLELPVDKYFELILKLVKENVLPGSGSICFSERDIKRMPSDFAKKLVSVLPEGSKVELSKEDAKIDGGFILKYEGIEQDLSLDAIFEEKKDQMTDAAGKILFS